MIDAAETIRNACRVLYYRHEELDAANPMRVKVWATEAFALLKQPGYPCDKVWNMKKAQVMWKILWVKFTKERAVLTALMDSGYTFLIEESLKGFWGIGSPIGGMTPDAPCYGWCLNRLGLMPMGVRDQLHKMW